MSWSMVEEVFLDMNLERLGWSRIWILCISLSSRHYILTAPLKTLIYTTYQQKITGQVLNKSYSEGTLLRIVLIRFGNSLSFSLYVFIITIYILFLKYRPAGLASSRSRNAKILSSKANLFNQNLHLNRLSGFQMHIQDFKSWGNMVVDQC